MPVPSPADAAARPVPLLRRRGNVLRAPDLPNSDLHSAPILGYALDAMGRHLVVVEAGNSGRSKLDCQPFSSFTWFYPVTGETGSHAKFDKKSTVSPCPAWAMANCAFV